MIRQALVAAEVRTKTNGPVLQRKCACGTHTIGGGECTSCQKAALAMGPSNDEHEQEAERIANQVTGLTVQRQASPAAGSGPVIDAGVESRIRGAAGGGAPLASTTRAFLEPKFGRDFSGVRIHSGSEAADLTRKLDAEAFTTGSDIFFNAGRYQPSSPAGLHLLAHELTHVVQQSYVPQVQRAKIPYGTLSWTDFKKTPPANAKWEAETASGFDIPNWKSTKTVAPTGNSCTLKGKTAQEHEATVFVDPSIYDAVLPYMSQEGSYVKAHLVDGAAHCSKTAAGQCEKELDTQTQRANADCKQAATECGKFFDQGNTSYNQEFNGVKVEAKSKGDCSGAFQSGCNAEMAKNAEFSLKDYFGAIYATAKKKTDCKAPSFQTPCVAHETALSAQLLKHEQGHFDISKKMADKARPDLKAKAAAFTVTKTACGKIQAGNAAQAKFNALHAGDTLTPAVKGGSPTRVDDWVAKRQSASDDYDTDTDHGMKDKEQAAWVATIAGGLTAYDLNPPPPAPPPPAGSAATPGTNP